MNFIAENGENEIGDCSQIKPKENLIYAKPLKKKFRKSNGEMIKGNTEQNGVIL